MSTIGVPAEVKDGERRVALDPVAIAAAVRAGHTVRVQASAGTGAGFADADYKEAGAEIVNDPGEAWAADLVVKVKEPQPAEYGFFHPDLTLFTFLHLAAAPDLADALVASGVTAYAYETLTQGDQTSWDLGFQFSMPVGFRAAHAQVRNLELRVSKSRSALAAQELEIAHELAVSFQELDRFYRTAQTYFNRRLAAQKRVQAVEAEYEAGRTTLDLLLRAQTSLAQAEIAYYRSLIEYNKAVSGIHFRKGTLLELNQVALAEGPWEPKAYVDALRRAWARTHAIPAPTLHAEPEDFAVPAPDMPLPVMPLEGETPLLLPNAREAFEAPGDEPIPPPAPAEPEQPEGDPAPLRMTEASSPEEPESEPTE
ncbi:MAG: TolC family protein [Planctomycetes bacterium]|nr:TolC family protein [Planctomycetota bacterium]